MYTGQEIFNNAISILDELSENGDVDPTQVKEYSDRAPYLLDMWQKKIAKSGELYYISEYVNSDKNNVNKWVKYEIPNNLRAIKEIMFIDNDLQIGSIEFKQFGRKDIYFRFRKTGTVRILYMPIPTKITGLEQSLEVDDITAQSGSWYLAEQFALGDQNTELADKCSSEFNSIKSELNIKKLSPAIPIRDVYGGLS